MDTRVKPAYNGRQILHRPCRPAAWTNVLQSRLIESVEALRGWHHLPLYQDISGEFSRDYHALTKDGGNDAAFNAFTRRRESVGSTIRYFWGGEMNGAYGDPGEDKRRAILDVTPEGRGTDWYPKLNYS